MKQTITNLWRTTVSEWKKANGFIKNLPPPDLNKPYSELTGLEKACIQRFLKEVKKGS